MKTCKSIFYIKTLADFEKDNELMFLKFGSHDANVQAEKGWPSEIARQCMQHHSTDF